MNELGNKIKLWRNYRNLTLEQLNALTGIHYARLSKFERGVEIPNQQMLERIEKALDVKFANLTLIDREIEDLIIEFIDTIFYLKMNYDHFENKINQNREAYMINHNYYKVILIEYIINILLNKLDQIDKFEKILDCTVEQNTLYEQLYLEYKALKMHSLKNYKDAFSYIERALSISNNYKNTAMINYHLSLLHHDCGHYEKARKYLIQAKQMFVEFSSYKRAVHCDFQMANVYTRLGSYEMALDIQKASLETFQYMQSNSSIIALTLRNTAWVHILMKNYTESLKYLNEAEKLEPENGNMLLYKIWCNFRLGKFNTARKIIDDSKWLCDNNDYKERFKLFKLLVNLENQKATKKIISQARKVYEDLANRQRYGNMFFYLDILIELLESAGDKDELIHYLKIKGHLGK